MSILLLCSCRAEDCMWSLVISAQSWYRLCSCHPAESTWSRLISAEFRSHCCFLAVLQTVRDLIWYLHHVYSTAAFSHILQIVRDLLWYFHDVDLTAVFSSASADSTWSLLMSVERLAAFWLLLQKVCNVVWYLENANLTSVADCTWWRLMLRECQYDCRRILFPLQTVRDLLLLCLHNVDLTAVFYRSCVISLFFFFMSAVCRPDCCVLAAPTDCPDRKSVV